MYVVGSTGDGQVSVRVSRKRRYVALAATLIIAVSVLMVAPVAGIWGITYHRSCAVDAAVDRSDLLTPVALVNSPYLGTAEAVGLRDQPGSDLPVPGLAGTANASNGSSVGLFSLNEWSLLPLTTGWALGPGASDSCSSPFVAEMSPEPLLLPTGGFTESFTLLGSGNHSDSTIPVSLNWAGYSSVSFDANLVDDGQSGIGSCTGPGTDVYDTLDQLNVSIPAPTTGGPPIVTTVPDSVSYSYDFPPGGSWLTGTTPSAGWGFDFTGCQ
jgi:hypothetical protein